MVAFLDVERSLAGRRWRLRAGDERHAETISQRFGLPSIVGRMLVARGVDVDAAPLFLNPTLKALLPDPLHLKGMTQAVERLCHAIREGETVAIFGDYDVDGATSSALLLRFLRTLGLQPVLYIPDRITEGYGPNTPAMLALKERGVDLVITVDCGTTAFEPLQAAATAGLDVIVVDHHEAEPILPEAVAIINPKRLDDPSEHKHLAAVGVAFLLIVAVNRALRQQGWYSSSSRPEPDLMAWLDIVALGTVCDVVPLVGVNRALVTRGLEVMARRGNAGLAALADVAKITEAPTAFHLGYLLGPRVNAGGRVGQADLGARLLACDDPAEAGVLALRLHEYNAERQDIEAAVLFEAIEQAESRTNTDDPLVMVAGENWHPGVIGIVAGRLKERYNLPVCVVALDGGMAKGSGRSVVGLDLGRAVLAAREAGLLEAGGGHAMAAGFSLKAERLDQFRQFLADRLASQLKEGSLSSVLEVDGAVDIRAATPDLLQTVEKAGPFGAGNEPPKFVVPSARIVRADVVGQGHVRMTLTGACGGRLKAIAFRSVDTDLGVALLNAQGTAYHLAGSLRLDTWQGRNECQLVVEDAAPA
ncbi:single-stranded-DNA-specific exonuclease RecJ [Haematospirillum jordaniae]|uniref:Single-stranded-DNA-specific exonuclease RecJ n=1 Tax=Haematospirillum jordaniae TaxID=1549855 RepID=A0A143DF57_9PROT|nr:single-stranded-DNA-specific exonuclease RecJ [Haematospirillum jordaniae]AMW35371.1 single-stranded-DNA-specific exonuclease RecJ [Haematospirillum jordaniae]NKD45206.1 single-stranded-DNA-specific exonuclease RecJ [Haematospirillum jordaniae]NKD56208.1 single-stranded-DNA-specific exonuclease RecJ [Haematospirillum jordaniae]NKD58265.1 single-stranded-DNA-specific exonuclease RecJ [Haematospirillum jordaniae]NKD66563.1 single-stranded-DNA-specific exonuclease RecJ [Haematospirillum jordan